MKQTLIKLLVKDLRIEDLPDNYQELAATVGMEAFLKLTQDFGGASFYVPQTSTVTKDFIHRRIVNEYNGGNARELARKYGISERQIWNIMDMKGPMENQQTLFDD